MNKRRKAEPRGDSRGVDTLPFLGIVSPLLAKNQQKTKAVSHMPDREMMKRSLGCMQSREC